MKKLATMILTLALAGGMLAIPAFAASRCVDCGERMSETTYRAPWITVKYVDCTHGELYAKDAVEERTIAKTSVCTGCQHGFTTEEKKLRYYCIERRQADENEFEETPCTFCGKEVELVKTHYTPWITTEKLEDGRSLQERKIICLL